jgi:hypothetical protein
MRNLLPFSLGIAVSILTTFAAHGQPGGTAAGKIQRLEIMMRSGGEQKDFHSRLYLLVARRVGSGGATVAKSQVLMTKGYEYRPEDKWGPNEDKIFKVFVLDGFSRDDFGGITIVNAMDKPNETGLEIAWINVIGTDQAGKRWMLAEYRPATNAQERRWLRNKPDAGDYPALFIPTLEWKEEPTK